MPVYIFLRAFLLVFQLISVSAMAENTEDRVASAKELLLDFRQYNSEQLEEALTILSQRESPEYFEMDRIGEDTESSGFIQRYVFRELGILVEKKDEKVVGVRKYGY